MVSDYKQHWLGRNEALHITNGIIIIADFQELLGNTWWNWEISTIVQHCLTKCFFFEKFLDEYFYEIIKNYVCYRSRIMIKGGWQVIGCWCGNPSVNKHWFVYLEEYSRIFQWTEQIFRSQFHRDNIQL